MLMEGRPLTLRLFRMVLLQPRGHLFNNYHVTSRSQEPERCYNTAWVKEVYSKLIQWGKAQRRDNSGAVDMVSRDLGLIYMFSKN